jgi:hypothetical protein
VGETRLWVTEDFSPAANTSIRHEIRHGMFRRSGIRLGVLLLLLLVGSVIAASNVSDRIHPADRDVIDRVLFDDEKGQPPVEDEIEFLKRLQSKVLKLVPIGGGIALRSPREPADVLRAGEGLCFDRSRLMKKALLSRGFTVRTVFLVYSSDRKSVIGEILRSGAFTHQILEVKTARGWVFVDTNYPWIGYSGSQTIIGQQYNPLDRPHVAIRGLYSRHGLFYPPYNRLPDVNYPEFLIGNLSAAISAAIGW